MNRVTAQDVAKAAGVSVATVDRVLNKRSGVSQNTMDKVHSAMEQLSFVRDQAAADLARGKNFRFTFIVPAGETAFFNDVRHAIEAVRADVSKNRIDIQMIAVPPLSPEAVVTAIDKLGADIGDGVAIVAIESQLVRNAINRLRSQGVHVVTFISDIPNSARERFIGIDNVAAGRVAASLIKRFVSAPSGDVAVVAGSGTLRDHVERHMGFEQVMRSECAHLSVLPWIEGEELADVASEKLSKLLAENTNIVALYSLGGGTRGVIEAIEEASSKMCVVTTELSEHTREALISGVIDAVLVQDPNHEVRSAVRILKALAENAPINESQERIRIEIFIRDNLP